METKLFVAAKAFVVHRGKTLIIRESAQYKTGTQIGKYDVPGGRIKIGEDLWECLRREVREETGLEVKIGKPLHVHERRITRDEEQWQIIRIFFLCETDSEAVTLSRDHDDFRWITPEEYKNHQVIDNLYPVFDAYLGKT